MSYEILPSKQKITKFYGMSLDDLNAATPLDSAWYQGLLSNKDPLQYILAIRVYPVKIQMDLGGTYEPVKAGPHTITGLSATTSSGYSLINSTSITVPAHTYFYDIEPYSSAELYLPFLGIIPISLSEVRGTTLNIRYLTDWRNGQITAYVSSGTRLIKTITGSFGSEIPLTLSDNARVLQTLVSSAIGAAVATAGGGGPALMKSAVEGTTGFIGLFGDTFKGNSGPGWTNTYGPYYPILTIKSPKPIVPDAAFLHLKGKPYMQTVSLSILNGNGYTQVESVHLENSNMLASERTELESLLKSGVIF